MDVATERALALADELELVTTGRVSGQAHRVRLRFAYDDGVVWLRTGEEAIAELRRHPVRLVVLDLGLPGIDGFEV